MNRLRWLCPAALLLALVGCVQPGGRVVDLVRTYDREGLRRELRRQADTVTTLKARVRVDYQAPGEGAKGADALLRYQAPDRVRLRGDADFVGQVFDLASDGERFWYWFDPQGGPPPEVTTGSVEGLARAPEGDLGALLSVLAANPAEVLGLVRLPAETPGRTLLLKTYPDRYVVDLVALEEGRRLRPLRQWVLDRVDLTSRRIEAYGEGGRPLVVARLSGHRSPGPGIAPVAREVELRFVDSGTTLRFRLRRVEVNQPIRSSLFRLQVPEGSRLVELR